MKVVQMPVQTQVINQQRVMVTPEKRGVTATFSYKNQGQSQILLGQTYPVHPVINNHSIMQSTIPIVPIVHQNSQHQIINKVHQNIHHNPIQSQYKTYDNNNITSINSNNFSYNI
jgi:hypothetical protein